MTWLRSFSQFHSIAIATGVVLGLMLSPAIGVFTELVFDAFDDAYPVLVMRGEVRSVSQDEVILQISGEKKRSCQFLRISAYTRDAVGNMQSANIKRIGVQELGITRPIGKADIGTWRIWPRDGASGVLVFVTHNCSDRTVTTKVADVVLK